MSDFLSKFSKENYVKDDKLKNDSTSPTTQESNLEDIKFTPPELMPDLYDEPLIEVEVEVDGVEDDEVSVDSTELSVDEEIVIENTEKKMTLADARRDDKTSIGEEDVEIDPEYKQKKRKKQILIAAVAVAVLIVSSIVYYMVSYVKLPDFTGKPLTELQVWAKDNKMQIESTPTYTIEYDKNVIVSQESKPNRKIRKGSKVLITLSQGADPDETVSLPKLEGMKLTEINAWIETNKMDNVRVIQEYSDTIEKDVFIKVEIRDKDVTNESFKRKNGANIYVSQGKETFEENIKVLDFKGKSQTEVETWHKENKFIVDFTFEEAYDDKTEAGMIISQSISVDTMIAKDKSIAFTISKGKALVVPNYSGTTMAQFETILSEGVNVQLQQWYHPTAKYGAFLEQSVAAGTNVSDTPTQPVIVYYSIGKPYIDTLAGKTEGELPEYFYNFSSKGANITYTVIYQSSPESPKGTVFKADKQNQFVNRNDHITIYVSNGN